MYCNQETESSNSPCFKHTQTTQYDTYHTPLLEKKPSVKRL